MINKKGQVWIETVLYILIGLSLIGLILAFVTPRITQEKERALVEQTIESLNVVDSKINEVLEAGIDNVRVVEFSIGRGELYFKPEDNQIEFIIKELSKPYSEPGVELNFGRIKEISMEEGKKSLVKLTLDYSNLANLTFEGKDEEKKFNPAATPYRFSIRNKGNENSLFEVVDVSLISS
jgi:type II secretory pathway pseudopilin PulG